MCVGASVLLQAQNALAMLVQFWVLVHLVVMQQQDAPAPLLVHIVHQLCAGASLAPVECVGASADASGQEWRWWFCWLRVVLVVLVVLVVKCADASIDGA